MGHDMKRGAFSVVGCIGVIIIVLGDVSAPCTVGVVSQESAFVTLTYAWQVLTLCTKTRYVSLVVFDFSVKCFVGCYDLGSIVGICLE